MTLDRMITIITITIKYISKASQIGMGRSKNFSPVYNFSFQSIQFFFVCVSYPSFICCVLVFIPFLCLCMRKRESTEKNCLSTKLDDKRKVLMECDYFITAWNRLLYTVQNMLSNGSASKHSLKRKSVFFFVYMSAVVATACCCRCRCFFLLIHSYLFFFYNV